MIAETAARLARPPFALESELWDALAEHGYRIGPEWAAGWMFARSATAPGEIAVGAAGAVGPYFLSIEHPGAARELELPSAGPPARGHHAAFVVGDRDALRNAVSSSYRLSVSLPTLPLDIFLRDTTGLGETEADALVRLRIGQDVFRTALMHYWNRRCPLTGIGDPDLLRASHIVPWSECTTDAERLDVHNGLLLSALWDAAFDRGLVSFSHDGDVRVSPRLGDQARTALNVAAVPRLSLSAEAARRMTWHNARIFRAE